MSVYNLGEVAPELPKEDEYWIAPNAAVVGRVILKKNASVWFGATIRGDNDPITIGENSNVQDGSVLHTDTGYPLTIGANVTVGHKAMLHGCTIGNRVLVGMGAILLDGVVVEDDVMIGAGSLVPPGKRLASGFLYMGNPAKQARPLKPAEIAFLTTSADNYVLLKDEYLQEA